MSKPRTTRKWYVEHFVLGCWYRLAHGHSTKKKAAYMANLLIGKKRIVEVVLTETIHKA